MTRSKLHRVSTTAAFLGFWVFGGLLFFAARSSAAEPIRVGIIGCDTSHVVAFAKIFNDPKATGDVADVRVVAAYPGGSDDLAASRDRVKGFTEDLRKMDVKIVGSIDELLGAVDVVLLESVDGRKHLEQARPVFAAKKPVFIDKPLAADLADAIVIARLGKKHRTPWFSSSGLRFSPNYVKLADRGEVGEVLGCSVYSPCHLEPTHGDLFWYGIHGVETLYTLMGPGCKSVARTHTDATDVVTGIWNDGRVATYRGLRQGKLDYGATVFGTKKIASAQGYAGYESLVAEIARFFKTGKPPVDAEETLEIMAFMAAADASKQNGGHPTELAAVRAAAEKEADRREAAFSSPR